MLGAFYPTTCTIQAATVTQDGYGQPVQSWANVAGLSGLECVVGPAVVTSASGVNEVRRADGTLVTMSHRFALRGYYPTIAPEMRVTADGLTYNILGVEHDSHAATTRLKVEIIA